MLFTLLGYLDRLSSRASAIVTPPLPDVDGLPHPRYRRSVIFCTLFVDGHIGHSKFDDEREVRQLKLVDARKGLLTNGRVTA